MRRIILASKSNQRIEILGRFIKNLEHISPDVDETFSDKFDIVTNSMSVSKKKALAIQADEKSIVIASDTIVIFDNMILEKPKNRDEAMKFISMLAGNTHSVLSSFCILDRLSGRTILDYTISKVSFLPLSEEEIKAYIETNEWKDRAGAYAIQGYASAFVSDIEGDYMGIVGLPISEIYNHLRKHLEYNLLEVEGCV